MDKQIIENTVTGLWATFILYQTWSLILAGRKLKKDRRNQAAIFREIDELTRLAKEIRDLEQNVIKCCYKQADDLPREVQDSLLALSEHLSTAEAEYNQWKEKHPNL